MRTCHNAWCDYKTVEPLTTCPECGRQLLTDEALRGMGWLLMIPGSILVLAGITLVVLAGPRLINTTEAKLVGYGVFGLLALVGLAFMAAGLRQALTGGKSQSMIGLAIVLLAAIGLVVAIARLLL